MSWSRPIHWGKPRSAAQAVGLKLTAPLLAEQSSNELNLLLAMLIIDLNRWVERQTYRQTGVLC